ncbi:beta-2-glycoprotein 1-like [Melanotaenia boesemani]|uniref:beta-2-glycoprotein 1-like n=1 Tax=Melanotaenia boesemani TaxID=1250792 RepID=UPI001C03BDDC|nr:beta-2-glycoprotein 1-like [Melanotaenia boesemani]
MEAAVTLFLLCSVLFFSSVTSEQDNVCFRPELSGNIEMEGFQRFFSPGVELLLSCKQGYTPMLGPRKIVCSVSGEWTKTNLQCIPKLCPFPDPLSNGKMYFEDNVYQSTINYTCNEGYVLTGPSTIVCQANGTWSTPVPKCTTVTCGLAPVPQYGMVIYDERVRGNTTDFGITATYACRPPYTIFGNRSAECTVNGTWTKTPECRVVTCLPPENIERGYMSNNNKKEYDFMEKVKYDCEGNYVLEGNVETVCQQDGKWSEKPSCKAPCTVNIQRAKVFYKGKKMWIKDLNSNMVLHKEIISVYCKDKAKRCGYAVSTQCIDGKLQIPECFEEPSQLDYNNHTSSLPSEIGQC